VWEGERGLTSSGEEYSQVVYLVCLFKREYEMRLISRPSAQCSLPISISDRIEDLGRTSAEDSFVYKSAVALVFTK
jgi:hypothetical protein